MDKPWYALLALLAGLGIIALAHWLSRNDRFLDLLARVSAALRLPSARNTRRSRLLETPFPPEWETYLEENVAVYRHLSPEERAKLRDELRVLMAERDWEGCGGLELTDEVKVTIAAQACVLLLGIDHDYFSQVTSILVYPSGFQIPPEHRMQEGGIEEDGVGALGEAWYRGPVILAWDDALAGGRGELRGRNVVYHEFAHQIDYLGEWGGGRSLSARRKHWRRWRRVLGEEYRRLVRAAETGRPTLLDKYGATNPAEMFAVATECFFMQPEDMRREHPRLYGVLRDFYNQDPAARVAGPTAEGSTGFRET